MVAKVEGGATGGAITMGALLDRFLTHAGVQGRSPTTIRKYEQIADAVIRPVIGAVKLSNLTAQHLDALYATLVAKGNRATTIRRVHALIGAALHQAIRWDLVERDVSRKASPPLRECGQSAESARSLFVTRMDVSTPRPVTSVTRAS